MKLSPDARNNLKSSTFALPGKRAFPIPDKVHAQKALQLVGRSVAAGNTTPAQAATVRSKARAKLHGAVDAIRNH
jgi:hypothetical protein